MGKIRSLNQQINYSISQNCRIGVSKRADKRNPVTDSASKIYSVQYAENIRDTAKNFTNWAKENCRDLKMVKDIKPEHINAWINCREKNWSNKTLENHISRMKLIQKQLCITYGLTPLVMDWSGSRHDVAHTVRDKAMSREDCDKIRKVLSDKVTKGRVAIEITSRTGLRVKEVARLHSKCINTTKWVIEVREGAKNGRFRDVPIRENDRSFFAELKENTKGYYVCNGVKEDSLNVAIRRAMKELNLDKKYPQTEHAVRKLYSSERMEELRGHDKAENRLEREAWSIVQGELGHGEKYRDNLYKVYVK